MDELKANIFKYRSYTPIPFLILMVIFQEPTFLSIFIGLLLAVSGEFIRFWGVSYAGSETRTTGAVGGTYLIISGPFAYVRNPLYVGNMLMYVGIGVMSMALFPYLQIVALGYFIFQYWLIVQEEENYLRNYFGKDYDIYYLQVPRFIPRLTPFKNFGLEQPTFNKDSGLKSETRTLQAFGIVVLIILVTYIIRLF